MKIKLLLVKIFHSFFRAIRLFLFKGLQNHSAATGLFLLLSLSPLILLFFSIFSFLEDMSGNYEIKDIFLAALYDQFHLNYLSENGVIPAVENQYIGGISILTLIFSSQGILRSTQDAIAVIFSGEKRRSFFAAWAVPFFIMPLAFFLLLIALLGYEAFNYIDTPNNSYILGYNLADFINRLLAATVAYCLVFIGYSRLPPVSPKLSHVASAALICVLNWILILSLTEIIFDESEYIQIYGAFGGVIVILLLFFLLAAVFYFWAQFLHCFSEVEIALTEMVLLKFATQQNKNKLINLGLDFLKSSYGKKFLSGQSIIHHGDKTDKTIFFLLSGRVSVSLRTSNSDQPIIFRSLAPGDIFGEMAYLLNEARTASVKAVDDVYVLAFPPDMFERLLNTAPRISRMVIENLSRRLNYSNEEASGKLIS